MNVSPTQTLAQDTKAQDLAAAEMELKLMKENRRKKDKGKHNNRDQGKAEKDKGKLDGRIKHASQREGLYESDGATTSPKKTNIGRKNSL